MRQRWIDCVESRLHLSGCHVASYKQGQKTAAITDHHRKLRGRQMRQNLVLNRLRRNVMAGVEDEKVLNSADNFPISRGVHLALIAGVKPAVAQNFRGFVRTVPVSGE